MLVPSVSALILALLILVVIGFVVYLIDTRAPIDGTFKLIIKVISILVAVLIVLRLFGIF